MKRSYARCLTLLAAVLSFASPFVIAQTPPRVTPMTPDVVEKYDQTLPSADYIRREVMIPMRDGVKLFTVVVNEEGVMDAEFVTDNYIRVYQDIHGMYRSEGEWILNRPISGPLNKTGIDEATDAYDTCLLYTSP